MRLDETRALMQECFSLSEKKYGKDFYSLSEEQQTEIISEAEERVTI